MKISERIIAHLKQHPEGVDDDNLSVALALKQRQQANSRCRGLEKQGIVIRKKIDGKIHNFWTGIALPETASVSPIDEQETPYWYWEGNVQDRVADYLKANHHKILSMADTASRQQGIDIIGELDSKQIWITVKGYPKGTPKTSPSTQAGHWLKQAIFDILVYRQKDNNVRLAVALPDFKSYRSLAQKIQWIKPIADFDYYWVNDSGVVTVE